MTPVGEPAPVESFAGILADWLSAFTVPQELAGEMADACAAGAPWAAGVAGVAARRAGWTETEALAWGTAVGALAGSLEAARRSLAPGAPAARAAEGPALSLLAADGLMAGAHEALASLPSERLVDAMAALEEALRDGGPYSRVDPEWPRPAWPAVVALALAPAAAKDPAGPWAGWAAAWREAFASPGADPPEAGGERLWDEPAAAREDRSLMRAAAAAALAREPAAGPPIPDLDAG